MMWAVDGKLHSHLEWPYMYCEVLISTFYYISGILYIITVCQLQGVGSIHMSRTDGSLYLQIATRVVILFNIAVMDNTVTVLLESINVFAYTFNSACVVL